MAKLRPNDKARPSTEDIIRLAELKRQKDPLESDDLNREWALKAWPDIERRAFFYSKLNPLAAREDNWFAAERDILKGITSEELKDVEGQIRGMIQHENDLLNHRIQWFLIINGFLLTATASLKTKPTNETLPMLAILALVGFLVCISFWFSLGIGRRGVGRLADMWEHYRDLYYRHEPPSGCHLIGVLGWRSTKWASRAAPWFALPILFSSVWILLFYVHLVSISTLNTPKNNPQIQIEKQNARPQKPSVHKDQNSTNNVLVPANQESRKPASIELSTTANKQATAETALRKDILSNIAGLELSLNPSSLQVMDKVVRELDWGNIVFTTPRTMKTEEPVIIELALSATKSAQDLQSSLHTRYQTEKARIQISNRMEASLSGLGFKIEALQPLRQAVYRGKTTYWKWEVTPTEDGLQKLHLSLSAMLKILDEDVPLVVQTYEKTINVDVSMIRHVSAFASKNWQWLWASILVPLAPFIWKWYQENHRAKKK